MTALLTGFFVSFSLILAIGGQNALVLRNGLARNHVFAIVSFCALSDAILIVAGVVGFGAVVALYPNLPFYMAFGGAIFLIGYGLLRLYAAFTSDYAADLGGHPQPLRKTLATVAAMTWLNPHVYLDTLALIGAVSTRFVPMDEKIAFTIGAVSASFVFFFSLGFGARLLSPYMSKPSTWRALDVVIAIVMFILAWQIALSAH